MRRRFPSKRAVFAAYLAALAWGWPASGVELSGSVFDDRNGNGIQDPDEPGLGGVAVTVFGRKDSGGTFDRTVTTDGSGRYRLQNADGLREGCYLVDVAVPGGFDAGLSRADCPAEDEGWPVKSRRYSDTVHLQGAARANAGLYLAMGDSNSAGSHDPLCGDRDWVEDLGPRLQCIAPGMSWTNDSVGGEKTHHLLVDDDRNNVFEAVRKNPALISISIGGNDYLAGRPADRMEPFTDEELAPNSYRLNLARRNLQEILSYLLTELPQTDIVVTTYYDPNASRCTTDDFTAQWGPIWMEMLRSVAAGQIRPVGVSQLDADLAHLDVNRQNCCGETGAICLDQTHVNGRGAQVELEKHWEALGGVNLGPRDGVGATTISNVNFPLLERKAVRSFRRVTDLGGGTEQPRQALERDDTGALVPGGTGELRLSGLDSRYDGIGISAVKVFVRYRTTAPPADDFYRFEASVSDFAEPGVRVTDWNTYTPIVGGEGDEGAAVLAKPHVPEFREVSALLTVNLKDDGKTTGSYSFDPPTWDDLAKLQVRLRNEARGEGPDPFQVEWDAAWVVVYGRTVSGSYDVFRASSPAGLTDPANRIATVATTEYEDPVLEDPTHFFYLVRNSDGTEVPGQMLLDKNAASVRLDW